MIEPLSFFAEAGQSMNFPPEIRDIHPGEMIKEMAGLLASIKFNGVLLTY